jgi:hypothetical protein
MNPVLVPAEEYKFLGWNFSAVPEGIPPLSESDPTLGRRKKMVPDVVHKNRPDFVTGTPMAITPLEEGDYFIIEDRFHDSARFIERHREKITKGYIRRVLDPEPSEIGTPHHAYFNVVKIVDVGFFSSEDNDLFTHGKYRDQTGIHDLDPRQKALRTYKVKLSIKTDEYQMAMKVYEDLVDQLAQANFLEFRSSHDKFLVDLAKNNRQRLLNMLRRIRYIDDKNNEVLKGENREELYPTHYFPDGSHAAGPTDPFYSYALFYFPFKFKSPIVERNESYTTAWNVPRTDLSLYGSIYYEYHALHHQKQKSFHLTYRRDDSQPFYEDISQIGIMKDEFFADPPEGKEWDYASIERVLARTGWDKAFLTRPI